MQNKIQRFGPVALTVSLDANIIHPADSGANGVGYTASAAYIILRHIRILNKSAAAASFSLYIGATGANAAGTEFMGILTPIAAYSCIDWYGQIKLTNSDYLVGGASANSALTLTAEGEVGLA